MARLFLFASLITIASLENNMNIEQLELPNMNKLRELTETAIGRIKMFAKPEGYYFADSGGKDSCAVRDLILLSGEKYDAHYMDTTCDPPEVKMFLKEYHPETEIVRPVETIFALVYKHGMPRRQSRWCCEKLKEIGGAGRTVITGVRWAESVRRQSRKMVEVCDKPNGKNFLHPIIDWTNEDVWNYIKARNIPYCKLYDEGFKRIGCVLCPMETARQTQKELVRFPKIARAWQIACHKYWDRHLPSTEKYASAEEMWRWWLSRKGQSKNKSQAVMFA